MSVLSEVSQFSPTAPVLVPPPMEVLKLSASLLKLAPILIAGLTVETVLQGNIQPRALQTVREDSLGHFYPLKRQKEFVFLKIVGSGI